MISGGMPQRSFAIDNLVWYTMASVMFSWSYFLQRFVIIVPNEYTKPEFLAINAESCKTRVAAENCKPKLLRMKKNQSSIFMERNNLR